MGLGGVLSAPIQSGDSLYKSLCSFVTESGAKSTPLPPLPTPYVVCVPQEATHILQQTNNSNCTRKHAACKHAGYTHIATTLIEHIHLYVFPCVYSSKPCAVSALPGRPKFSEVQPQLQSHGRSACRPVVRDVHTHVTALVSADVCPRTCRYTITHTFVTLTQGGIILKVLNHPRRQIACLVAQTAREP